MTISDIPMTHLSYKHRWITRGEDQRTIGVRSRADFSEDRSTVSINPGTIFEGYLYHPTIADHFRLHAAGTIRRELEEYISTNSYEQQGFFVTYPPFNSCIAVIGKLGNRLLRIYDPKPTPQPVFRLSPSDEALRRMTEETERLRIRNQRRAAEEEAKRANRAKWIDRLGRASARLEGLSSSSQISEASIKNAHRADRLESELRELERKLQNEGYAAMYMGPSPERLREEIQRLRN